jgi:hypothetical protein
MCRCWDCINKAHCVLRGRRGPCKYYIGPLRKELRDWSFDAAVQLPRPWHIAPGATTKANDMVARRA